jgi:hypothetical protein
MARGCCLPGEQERGVVRERMRAPAAWLQGEPGAGVHHRRAPPVDGRDDLLGVDSLQMRAGRWEMRVAQLAVDQRRRDPLVLQLNYVGAADGARTAAARLPSARRGEARSALSWLTMPVPESGRRSRRTAARREGPRGR